MTDMFQHTYKGSKLDYEGYEFVSACEFQHTYKGSKQIVRAFLRWAGLVPAYLQGFETPKMMLPPGMVKQVPAYLQGFETWDRHILLFRVCEFQHTYKGSKLEK